MHRSVLRRKQKVLKYIDNVVNANPLKITNESMCYCYILSFASLEYMIETLIRGWIQSNIRYHKHYYPGKSKVDNIIMVLNELAEGALKYNNGIDYDKICDLVGKLAGDAKKDAFMLEVKSFSGGAPALKASIDRIKIMRHNVAHGAVWPDETTPNVSELKTDFSHIYDCLIQALNTTLKRY